MAAKKRQTMGKLMRERERAEKRARKQEKKDAKKAAALAEREGGAGDPTEADSYGLNDDGPNGETPLTRGVDEPSDASPLAS
jgi:hypothetical protein